MDRRSLVWFRSDLRLLDNQALVESMRSSDEIYPVYVFDNRVFEGRTSYGFRKTGVLRARFILQSVADLSQSLSKHGLKLIVRVGHPEQVLANLAAELRANYVFCNRERTYEEVQVQNRLEKNLWADGREIRYVRGKMLLYTQDLPFPVMHAPDQFAALRKETEHFIRIRRPLSIPALKFGNVQIDPGQLPNLAQLGYDDEDALNPATYFQGGERQGQLHLQSLYQSNEDGELMSGTRLSPWISHGCLSPKQVYYQLVTNSKANYLHCKENLSASLLWRDYFRLIGKKYRHLIFLPSGPLKKNLPQQKDRRLEDALPWLEARTGVPIVDACLNELRLTGYLSYRGRVLVANYLVHELGADWLIGAEFFESLLLDYDPCSNYGNWNQIAGVGVDGKKEKVSSFSNQEKLIDPEGTYVEYWLSKGNVDLSIKGR